MALSNRYLLVSPAFPPPFVGGAKVWTYNMVEHSPEAFDILTGALPAGFQEVVSEKHVVWRRRPIWNRDPRSPSLLNLVVSYLYICWWLLKRRRSGKYRGMVAGGETFANGLMFIVGKLLGTPVIGLGNAEEFTLALRGRGWKNALKSRWIRFTHRHATGFVVVCHFCKRVLVNELGLDAERIDVVPSSINPGKLAPSLPQKVRGHHILSVGRIVERKGFHFLIDVVALLRDEIPDIHATIVGDGGYLPILKEKVRRQGLEAWVTLAGLVPDEELSRLYRDCDLFVLAHTMLPNGDTEGCPTVFSEASGAGLPVIGGVEGGADTVIIDGETGYLVDSRNVEQLADRIRRILTDPSLAECMGRAGLEKIRREHTPEITGKAFFRSVQRLVTGRPPGPAGENPSGVVS